MSMKTPSHPLTKCCPEDSSLTFAAAVDHFLDHPFDEIVIPEAFAPALHAFTSWVQRMDWEEKLDNLARAFDGVPVTPEDKEAAIETNTLFGNYIARATLHDLRVAQKYIEVVLEEARTQAHARENVGPEQLN